MAKLTGSSITMQFSVSEVSKLTSIRSPEVLMYGFPWQVEVKKIQNGTQESLAAFMYCTNNDINSNWAATACATIKLLPFSDDKQAAEFYVPPFVYHRLAIAYGTNALISWNRLLNKDNKYVKDDTIRLEAKIDAEDPNSLSRSTIKIENLDCCCLASIQLAVANVSNLMAVRSPKFMIRGMPWCILIFKNGAQLGVLLELMQHTGNVSCQVTMSVKLMSSKKGVASVENSIAGNIRWPGNLHMGNLVSWKDMMKSENGFVNGNSITLKIEIKADKPEGDLPNVNPNNVAKRRRLECSICLEELYDQDISATKCGHTFCTACITTAVRKRPVCPMCKKPVALNELRPLFLAA